MHVIKPFLGSETDAIVRMCPDSVHQGSSPSPRKSEKPEASRGEDDEGWRRQGEKSVSNEVRYNAEKSVDSLYLRK